MISALRTWVFSWPGLCLHRIDDGGPPPRNGLQCRLNRT